MGDVATWMIDCAYAQVGQAPRPADARLPRHERREGLDAQCGMESAGGTLLGALAGVNMISGAGMMDFESCQSLEKLVIDAEMIGMAKRLLRGIEPRDEPIALALFAEARAPRRLPGRAAHAEVVQRRSCTCRRRSSTGRRPTGGSARARRRPPSARPSACARSSASYQPAPVSRRTARGAARHRDRARRRKFGMDGAAAAAGGSGLRLRAQAKRLRARDSDSGEA